MHVAVLSYHGSPLAVPGRPSMGGMQVYIRSVSRALAQQGHTIDIFTRQDSSLTPTICTDAPGVRVISLPAGPVGPVSKTDLAHYVDEFAARVEAFAQDIAPYDIIHSHYWLSTLIGETLSRHWSVPHVTMFHTLAEVKSEDGVGEPPERIMAERRLVHAVDRIVVASPHERLQLMNRYNVAPENICVVACGVDTRIFQPGDKEESRDALAIETPYSLAFVGRIEPLKGVEVLLRAHALLPNREDVTVLLVGGLSDGHVDEPERLKRLTHDLGTSDQVRFLPPMHQADLPLVYQAADATIVPSSYESFGLVAVESLACGTPVIASRVGGLISTICDGENGFLVPWRTPEAFAGRIDTLLSDDELRAHLAANARPSVACFQWPMVASQLTSLYCDLQANHLALEECCG